MTCYYSNNVTIDTEATRDAGTTLVEETKD